MMQIRKPFFLSIGAGVYVSIAGSAFFGSDNRFVGAALFCVALVAICYQGLYLFTGKIGYLANTHDQQSIIDVLLTLLGNGIGTLVCGLAVGYLKPGYHGYQDIARTMCESKLELSLGQAFVAAVFCGILMYTAVEVFKTGKSPLGIFFCVPAFIIAGFEHSIADMFYFASARMFTGEAATFLAVVVLGNSVGGMLLPWLKMLAGEKHG